MNYKEPVDRVFPVGVPNGWVHQCLDGVKFIRLREVWTQVPEGVVTMWDNGLSYLTNPDSFAKEPPPCGECGAIGWHRGTCSQLGNGEVRVTDPTTGGEKGQKDAQLGTVDPLALLELAKVGGFGARKYERFNYLKGFAWSLSFDALCRHLLAYQSGEDRDPESGLPHLAHAMWHCAALLSFQLRGLGTDDRPSA